MGIASFFAHHYSINVLIINIAQIYNHRGVQILWIELKFAQSSIKENKKNSNHLIDT
jgi:hypothetical protein